MRLFLAPQMAVLAALVLGACDYRIGTIPSAQAAVSNPVNSDAATYRSITPAAAATAFRTFCDLQERRNLTDNAVFLNKGDGVYQHRNVCMMVRTQNGCSVGKIGQADIGAIRAALPAGAQVFGPTTVQGRTGWGYRK